MSKETKARREDEVDLGPIINALERAFRSLSKGISYVMGLIGRYAFSILFIIVITLGVGYGIYKIQKPVYYSSMVVTSNYLSPIYYHHILSELDLMIKDRNTEGLAEKLDLDEEEAEQLKSIYYLPLTVEGDTVREYQPFRVVVAAHDGRLFGDLTQHFLDFLKANSFTAELEEIEKQQLRASIELLKQEMQQLDTLKKVMEKSLLRGTGIADNGIALLESPEAVEVYQQKMEFFNQKQYQEARLEKRESIELIYPFTVRTKADEPKLLQIELYFLLIGFLVGMLISGWRDRRR